MKGSNKVMLLSIIINPSKPKFDKIIYDILQQPQYNYLKSNLQNFIEMVKEAITQWISKIINNAFSNAESAYLISSKLSTVFMVIGLLAIFAIIVIVIIKASKIFKKDIRVKEILGERIDDETTPNSLRRKACSFEVEGNFREAIRYDFIALLLLMHEKNLIYLDETKTNGEINNYLKKNNFSLISIFQYLIGIFNSSWYGHKLCGRDVYQNWSNSINELWSGVIIYESKKK